LCPTINNSVHYCPSKADCINSSISPLKQIRTGHDIVNLNSSIESLEALSKMLRALNEVNSEDLIKIKSIIGDENYVRIKKYLQKKEGFPPEIQAKIKGQLVILKKINQKKRLSKTELNKLNYDLKKSSEIFPQNTPILSDLAKYLKLSGRKQQDYLQSEGFLPPTAAMVVAVVTVHVVETLVRDLQKVNPRNLPIYSTDLSLEQFDAGKN